MTTPAALFEQARELERNRRFGDAKEVYEELLRIDPRHAQAWHQMGRIAFHQCQPETAWEYFRRAILIDGSAPNFHHYLGVCCLALGNAADAQACHEQALRLDPNHYNSLASLWSVLRARGRLGEAAACLQRLESATPRTADEHAARGILLVSLGRWSEGFEEHEYREQVLESRQLKADPNRKWNRSPLAGRRLLLHAEQGFGDTLQLVRYAPLIRQQGGQPILAVYGSLMALLEQSNIGPVVEIGQTWPAHDLELGMFSLPWAFRTTPETVPATTPYLRAKPELVEHWRKRLAPLSGFRVGIHWQGSANYRFDRLRSFPLYKLASLAAIDNVNLISLQKGPGSAQLPALEGAFPVVDQTLEMDQHQGAFMDTAAVIKNLDLVITCDTATAHLAGALGAPVWVALSAVADWRWGLDSDTTPWYPSMRLFRQTKFMGWNEVFERMAAELAPLAVQAKSRPRS